MKHKHHHRKHCAHAVAKTAALALAVALMVPIAHSWQQMSGSLQDMIGSVLPTL